MAPTKKTEGKEEVFFKESFLFKHCKKGAINPNFVSMYSTLLTSVWMRLSRLSGVCGVAIRDILFLKRCVSLPSSAPVPAKLG